MTHRILAAKVDRNFLVGLYLFLNQMQLSIDRSKWQEFSKYTLERFSIEEVLHALRVHGFPAQVDLECERKPNVNFFRRWLARKNYLYYDERSYICTWMSILASTLKEPETPDRNTICNLRLNLAYAAEIIYPRISEYKPEYSHIEHCNQSRKFQTRSLTEILGEEWPTKRCSKTSPTETPH